MIVRLQELSARRICSKRAGDYYDVAVRIAHPALPVIDGLFQVGRISKTLEDELHTHFGGALGDRFEIVDLEPEQDAVAVGLAVAIADGAVIVVRFKACSWRMSSPFETGADRRNLRDALASEQTLVPKAAGFHISDGYEGLGTHCNGRVTYCGDMVRPPSCGRPAIAAAKFYWGEKAEVGIGDSWQVLLSGEALVLAGLIKYVAEFVGGGPASLSAPDWDWRTLYSVA